MKNSKILFWIFLIIPIVSVAAKMNIVSLPKPAIIQSMNLNEAIQKRRSVRHFIAKPLSAEQISLLLWSAQGITDARRGLRAAPSAGALYPLEVYLVKPDGVWHYLVRQHALQQVITHDLRKNLFRAALSQSAPMNIVIAADYARTTVKYGQRGHRYVHMEVGHAAQNILLEAQALGLSAVTIGAFNDSVVNKLLQLPKKQTALYIISVGYAK
ncbi:MAG: SagB/ThcOx family dehydrogenase [Gammaproteobacteria bacterium]